jgi:hypothetical protein
VEQLKQDAALGTVGDTSTYEGLLARIIEAAH